MPDRVIDNIRSRFALSKHEMTANSQRADHFDLFLQFEDHLETWELLELPEPDKIQLVNRLTDHRIFYLDFEGPLSDDRGKVSQIDVGVLDWLDRDSHSMRAQITGSIFRGIVNLDHPRGEMAESWRLTFLPFDPTHQTPTRE